MPSVIFDWRCGRDRCIRPGAFRNSLILLVFLPSGIPRNHPPNAMKSRLSTRFPRLSAALPAALLMCVPGLLSAQLRDTPDFAPFILDERVEREDYNLKLGPVEVDVIAPT